MTIEPKRTKTVCFRVSEEIIKEIEKEARTNLTSTNVLINHILHNYVSWYRYDKIMRMFPMPETSLTHVLENLNELQKSEAVDIAYNNIRDWTLVSKKKFDLNSCLDVLQEYCRISGISVDDNVSSGYNSFIIRHNLGRKASSFIIELVEKVFWDLKKIKVDTHSTNSTVKITLRTRID